MGSNVVRAAVGIVAVVAAVVLFIVLSDSADDGGDAPGGGSTVTTTGKGGAREKPPVPTIAIKGGKPVGGIAELTYEKGERARFEVESDVSDEVHVHGYDISKDVEAGGSVSFDFPATIEGVFEAELEERAQQILQLTVNP